MIHNRNKIIFFITLFSGMLIPREISSMFRMCSSDTVGSVFVPQPRGVTTITVTNNHGVPAAPRAKRSSAKVVPIDLTVVEKNVDPAPQSRFRFESLSAAALNPSPVTSPRRVDRTHKSGGAYGSPRGRTLNRSARASHGEPRGKPSPSPIIFSPTTTSVRRSLKGPHKAVDFIDTVTELGGDFASPTTAAARAARERRHTTGGRPPQAVSGIMGRVGSFLEITDLSTATSPKPLFRGISSPRSTKPTRRNAYEKTLEEIHADKISELSERIEEMNNQMELLTAAKTNNALFNFIHQRLAVLESRKYLSAESEEESPEEREYNFLNEARSLLKEHKTIAAKTFLIKKYSDEYSDANREVYVLSSLPR